jgi:hypothetical protein
MSMYPEIPIGGRKIIICGACAPVACAISNPPHHRPPLPNTKLETSSGWETRLPGTPQHELASALHTNFTRPGLTPERFRVGVEYEQS